MSLLRLKHSQKSLVRNCDHYLETMMTDETTSELLAEIEGQAADTPTTEYTPPEGWRVLAVDEVLRAGDMLVQESGELLPTKRVGETVVDGQYLRPIEPQPEPVQVCEGRWRTRGGEIKNIRPCEPLRGPYFVWPWTDGFMTFQDNGRHLAAESDHDLVEYLGPIEPQPEPVPEPQADQIEELRSEVSHVQRLLGESRQRVTQLEDLVGSLRTINETQEKAFEAAGKENTALRLQVQNRQQEHERQKSRIEFLETLNAGNGAAIGDYIAKVAKLQSLVDTARGQLETAATEHDSLSTQLAAVKAEVVQERLERNRYQNQVLRLTAELDSKTTECRNLRIELDALQQAPQAETVTTAPTSKDDRFEEGWDAGTARAVETIAEWTEPFRTCGSERLAWMVMQNLPHIMRTLTGLAQED